jgi:hypothetical protein
VTIHIEQKYAAQAVVHINKISPEKFISITDTNTDTNQERKQFIYFGDQIDAPLKGDYFLEDEPGVLKYRGKVRVNITDEGIFLNPLAEEKIPEFYTEMSKFQKKAKKFTKSRRAKTGRELDSMS